MLPRIFRQNSIDNFFDDFAFRRAVRNRPQGRQTRMERPDEDGHPRQRRTVHRGHRAPGLQEGRHRDRAQQRLPDRDRQQPLRERRKGATAKFIRRERFTGQCSRSLFIGEHVKQEDVKAKFENGVLSLTFRKRARKPRRARPSQSKDNRKSNLPKKTHKQRKGDGLRPSPFACPYPRRSSGARPHPRKCSVRYSINSSTTPGSFHDFLQIRLILRTVLVVETVVAEAAVAVFHQLGANEGRAYARSRHVV